jgi:hypothetical protein
MAILSFDGRVAIAVRIVTAQYPQATLWEADGRATGGPTTDPAKMDKMKVVFGNDHGRETVTIQEIKYGEFGKPELTKQPWTEDVVIQWPIKMDLPEANALKEKAGYKQPYTAVTLRNPLGPKKTNPFFIFSTTDKRNVFVDVVTGKVHAS